MKKSTKALSLVLALVLAVSCGVVGTLAWLSAKTNDVVNTFTFGNLNVTLTEPTGDKYQIVPGTNLHKNPKAAVKAVEGYDAVDAYLFVKAQKTDWPASNVTFEIAKGWTQVPGQNDVWYREVPAANYGQEYQILAGDETYTDGVVKVDGALTKAEVEAMPGKTPKLTFTAYAVQQTGFDGPAAAWAEASKLG